MEKKGFDYMANLHKYLVERCRKELGDDPLQAHRRATWMIEQEGLGYASKEDLEKAVKQAKVPQAEDLFKKALGKRALNHFV